LLWSKHELCLQQMRVDFARQVRGLGVARVWKGVDCASDAGAQTNATLSSLKLLLLLNETQHANTMAAVNDVRNEMVSCVADMEESIHAKLDFLLSGGNCHGDAAAPVVAAKAAARTPRDTPRAIIESSRPMVRVCSRFLSSHSHCALGLPHARSRACHASVRVPQHAFPRLHPLGFSLLHLAEQSSGFLRVLGHRSLPRLRSGTRNARVRVGGWIV